MIGRTFICASSYLISFIYSKNAISLTLMADIILVSPTLAISQRVNSKANILHKNVAYLIIDTHYSINTTEFLDQNALANPQLRPESVCVM